MEPDPDTTQDLGVGSETETAAGTVDLRPGAEQSGGSVPTAVPVAPVAWPVVASRRRWGVVAVCGIVIVVAAIVIVVRLAH